MGYQTKKKLIQILAIVLAVLMVIGLLLVALTSCSPASKVNSSFTTETASETSTPITQDFLILRDGGAVVSVIRPDIASQDEKYTAIKIRRGIEKIT